MLTYSPSPLLWLADAPMFIDSEQVSALYHAVLKPDTEQAAIKLNLKGLRTTTERLDQDPGAGVSLSEILKSYFPFLSAEQEAEHKPSLQDLMELWLGNRINRSKANSNAADEETVELRSSTDPERQLVQLALHYTANFPERIRVISDPKDTSLMDPAFIQGTPRALVFLDLPRESILIPTAAELGQGNVITIFDRFIRAYRTDQNDAPPELPSNPSSEDNYWNWYRERFKSFDTMAILENVIADGGRVQWIAYRLALGDSGATLHLHLCGRGRYDTGTFAYNFIRRGCTQGIRLVGMLKSEPDMNVLAIYER
jgi:hypothetical protein